MIASQAVVEHRELVMQCLSDEDVTIIEACLRTNKHLTSLNLLGNKLGLDSAEVLAVSGGGDGRWLALPPMSCRRGSSAEVGSY